jgi:pilus assembly protein CpaE
MPVLVESDPARAGVLAGGMPAGSHVVGSVDQLDNWLAGRRDEYAIVLGPEVDAGEAAKLADRLRRSHPSTGIVLVRGELNADVFSGAMAAGIGAVVAEGDTTALSQSVERYRDTWEALHGPARSMQSEPGKVITIFSPKGGVGKTTLAVNLGLALAADGSSRVCVVDLDLAFGDVAITLQLVPDHTITEAIGLEDHLDFALLETLLTRHETSLTILAAPTQPDIKDRMPAALVKSVLRNLRSHFDFVVVDTSPTFDEHVLQALDETDECILMATLDVPTVKNVKMAIDTLNALNLLKDNRHLVLNRADDEVGLSPKNVESILGMRVDTALPTAVAVANATNHGRPIVLSKPEHPVSRAIHGLAGQFASTASSTRVDETPAGKRGLFGRRKK